MLVLLPASLAFNGPAAAAPPPSPAEYVEYVESVLWISSELVLSESGCLPRDTRGNAVLDHPFEEITQSTSSTRCPAALGGQGRQEGIHARVSSKNLKN